MLVSSLCVYVGTDRSVSLLQQLLLLLAVVLQQLPLVLLQKQSSVNDNTLLTYTPRRSQRHGSSLSTH